MISDYCHEHHETVYDLRDGRTSRQTERIQKTSQELQLHTKPFLTAEGQGYAGSASQFVLCNMLCLDRLGLCSRTSAHA